MTRHLQREVSKLKERIKKLGKIVQGSLDEALKAVVEKDAALASKVMNNDAVIDSMEVDIEEECLKLLALYQPVAIDLRFIIAAIKMDNDLERIGDLAANIAKQALFLSKENDIAPPFDLKLMGEKVQIMVSEVMEAMFNMDAGAAHKVCISDNEVDEIHREMYAQVERHLSKQPMRSNTLIRYLSVSRYLERIADHATNIAEDVIYLVEGYISRHQKTTSA